jgi:hypothetical protein
MNRTKQFLCLFLLIGSLYANEDELAAKTTTTNLIHCRDAQQPKKVEQPTFSEAYSVPAIREVRSGINVALSASFLYWCINQDSMDIGVTAQISPFNVIEKIYQASQYNPGFKIAAQGNVLYDQSFLSAEYTRISQSTYSNTVTSTALPLFVNWFGAHALDGENAVSPGTLKSHWKLTLDMLDTVWGRPFSQSSKLKFIPALGLRALWLPQMFEFTDSAFATSVLASFHSKNWSLGPIIQLLTHWNLGQGIRLEAITKWSLLFTSYHFSQTQNRGKTTSFTLIGINTPSRNAVTPTAELGLGFGWGSYVYNSRLFLDLSARYDFFVLWNQNTMHQISNCFLPEGSAGNLYMHGLTVNAGLQF